MAYLMEIRGDVPLAPQEEIDDVRNRLKDASKELDAGFAEARGISAANGGINGEQAGKLIAKIYSENGLKDELFALEHPGSLRLGSDEVVAISKAMLDLGMARPVPAQSADEPGAIPVPMLSSGAGAVIAPARINAALAAWDKAVWTDLSSDTITFIVKFPLWDTFIDYLRLAADHDGFVVS